MKRIFTFQPENAVLFLMDYESGEIPETMADSRVAASDSCIAVSTIHAMDGDVSVTLTDESAPPSDGEVLNLIFEGRLKASSGEVSVCSVANEKLASLDLKSTDCVVTIWANDMDEPDQLYILAKAL